MSVDRRRFLVGSGLTMAGALAAIRSGDGHTAARLPISSDLSSWQGVRSQFAVSPEYIHLSAFFLTSHPAPVREAIETYRRGLDDSPFLFLEHDGTSISPKVERAIAEYVGGTPNEIALTDSTTMGLALIYHGLPLRPGHEILTTEHDHYSHHESIRLSAARSGAVVKKIRLFDNFASITEGEIIARIQRSITPKTRVVGLTWVHSSTGLKLPIRGIADALAVANKNRALDERVLLVVDGVHGIGVEDVAIAKLGADLFAAGTHKWIFGPRGTGFIWARAETWKMMQPVIPSFAGGPYSAWMSGSELKGMQANWMTPGGFHSFEHRWALTAAFDFHKAIGRARVAERIHALNDQAKEGLAKMGNVDLYTPRGSGLSAGLICFDVKGMRPAAVVSRLLAKKMIASQSPYAASYVRLAPSLLNSPEEIDKTLGSIRELG